MKFVGVGRNRAIREESWTNRTSRLHPRLEVIFFYFYFQSFSSTNVSEYIRDKTATWKFQFFKPVRE